MNESSPVTIMGYSTVTMNWVYTVTMELGKVQLPELSKVRDHELVDGQWTILCRVHVNMNWVEYMI